jgi:hypothetical protein
MSSLARVGWYGQRPFVLGSILAHLPPLMRNCTFHWIQRWERASRSRPNSLVLLSSVRDHRLPRADRPALAGTLGPSCCGPAARLQPEGALPLPEPAERLAGDPVVAVLLQVPAGRFVFERSVGVGDGAAFPVLLDPLDGLPVGTMFPGLPCWRSRSRPCVALVSRSGRLLDAGQ